MTRLKADLLRNSRAPMSEQDHCLARLKSAFCFSSQGQAQLVNQPGPFCIHRELLFQEMALTWIPERVIFQSGIGMEWTVCFQEQLYGLVAACKPKLFEQIREWMREFFHDFNAYRAKSTCKAATPTGGSAWKGMANKLSESPSWMRFICLTSPCKRDTSSGSFVFAASTERLSTHA